MTNSGREQYTIGSMSLVLNRTVAGYEPLPDWPTVQPDPTVRRMASTLETPGHMNDRTGFGSESFGRGGQGSSHMGKGGPSSPSRYDGRSGGFNSGGAQSLDKFLESSSEEETDSSEEGSSEGSEEDSEEGSEEESEGDDGSEEESSDEEEGKESGDSEEASSSEEEAIFPSTPSNGKRR